MVSDAENHQDPSIVERCLSYYVVYDTAKSKNVTWLNNFNKDHKRNESRESFSLLKSYNSFVCRTHSAETISAIIDLILIQQMGRLF